MSENLIDVDNEIFVVFAIHLLNFFIVLQESINKSERSFPKINGTLLFYR